MIGWNKKSQELIKTPGVQFPDNLNSLTIYIIIRKVKAFVNIFEEKPENKQDKQRNWVWKRYR